MRNLLIAALALSATPAIAGITVTSGPGVSPFGSPATFDFDSATAAYDGTIYNSSTGSRAQPWGSTGGYIAVGPGNAESSAVLDLSAFNSISSITFLWGSVDSYNSIEILDAVGNTLMSFNGGDMGVAPPTGNQTDPSSNRLVTLNFTGADRLSVSGLRFGSTGDAFEADNVTVVSGAVPEPAMWAMMFAGFGVMGGVMRNRRAKVAFA